MFTLFLSLFFSFLYLICHWCGLNIKLTPFLKTILLPSLFLFLLSSSSSSFGCQPLFLSLSLSLFCELARVATFLSDVRVQKKRKERRAGNSKTFFKKDCCLPLRIFLTSDPVSPFLLLPFLFFSCEEVQKLWRIGE